jgi:hypothetical protein
MTNAYKETPPNQMPIAPFVEVDGDDDDDGTGHTFAPLIEQGAFIFVVLIICVIVICLYKSKDKQAKTSRENISAIPSSPDVE